MGDVAIDRAIEKTGGPEARKEVQAESKKLDESRARALDRADRREYAQRKFKIGGESRWRETL